MNYEDYIAAAETAMKNEQYPEAMRFFLKASQEKPDDVYALSSVGSVCAGLGKTEESVFYLKKALKLDPDNGDNYFNLGNAYFFGGDYGNALNYYAEAELKGCSKEVLSKLYYQKAMLCSLRGDVEGTLLNFQKSEDLDETHQNAIDPELLLEKTEVYLQAGDFDHASQFALQFISMNPGDLRGYVTHFQILLVKQDYAGAEKVLGDAFRYAQNPRKEFTLRAEQAALYVTQAENTTDDAQKQEYFKKAYSVMEYLRSIAPDDSRKETDIMMMELCIKMKQYDTAISIAQKILAKPAIQPPVKKETKPLSDAEIDAMQEEDIQIYGDLYGDEFGANAEIYYDENGAPVRYYPEGSFPVPEANEPKKEEDPASDADTLIEQNLRDRIYFSMLQCYMETEAYDYAYQFAAQISYSENPYYAYYGRYAEAFCAKKLSEQNRYFTEEQAKQKYHEALQYFREQMLSGGDPHFSGTFRARLYAEMGKFEEAEEIAQMLVEVNPTLDEYIEKLKNPAPKS